MCLSSLICFGSENSITDLCHYQSMMILILKEENIIKEENEITGK